VIWRLTVKSYSNLVFSNFWGFESWIFFFIIANIVSIGFNSGDWGGILRTLKCFEIQERVDLLVWAAALTISNVSFALTTGADVAIYGSDITLIHGDITKVVTFIHLSKETMKVIRQNLGLAFVYNLLAIPFAAAGYFSPALVILFFLKKTKFKLFFFSHPLQWLYRVLV
jgi:hypothetical protein